MDRREQEPKLNVLQRTSERIESVADRVGSCVGSVVDFVGDIDLRGNRLLLPALAFIAIGGALNSDADIADARGSSGPGITRYTDENPRTSSVTTTTFKESRNQTRISVKTSSRKPKNAPTDFDALKSTNPADPLAPKTLRYPAFENNPLDITIRVPYNFEFGKPTPATYIMKYDAKQKWRPRGVKSKNAKSHKKNFGKTPLTVFNMYTNENYGLTNFKDNLYYSKLTGKPQSDVNKHPSFKIKPNKTVVKTIMTTFDQCNDWVFRGPTAESDRAKFKAEGFDPIPPENYRCLPVDMALNVEAKLKKTKKRGGKKLVYESDVSNSVGINNVSIKNPTEIFTLPGDEPAPSPTTPTGPTGPTAYTYPSRDNHEFSLVA
ncbi:MAG: hypothetical protein AAB423_03670 [Patescibacteria group bacterium]